MGSVKGAWSQFEYQLVKTYPLVTSSTIHLENEHNKNTHYSSALPNNLRDSPLFKYFKKHLQ